MTVHTMGRPTIHSQVAAEIRAEMGRQKLSVNRLPGLLGRSQTYWQRRINGDDMTLDVDDLAALASLLKVPVSQFFQTVDNENPHPTPDGGSDLVRRQGLEPRTRWLRDTAPVIELCEMPEAS